MNILTIDLEEWFQPRSMQQVYNFSDWEKLEFRVENIVDKLLELFEKHSCKATFFCVGWLADKKPQVIKKIHKNGHEIASHSNTHQDLRSLTKAQIIDELSKSKDNLENIIGDRIYGFRAPNFSIRSADILELVFKCGYKYDSSYFVNILDNKKLNIVEEKEFVKQIHYEVFPSFLKICGINVPVGGGVYFRTIPFILLKKIYKHLAKSHRLSLYFHPYEFDQDEKKHKLSFLKSHIRYGRRKNNLNRLEEILKSYEFNSIKNILNLK